MSITLDSGGDEGTYQIQIIQEDFDGDKVVYTAPVTVTAGNGSQHTIRKEVYFIPTARRNNTGNFGLPLPADTVAALNAQLKVYIATSSGRQIAQLPIADTLINIDPATRPGASTRGTRLVLCVNDASSSSRPTFGMEPDFPSTGGMQRAPIAGNLEDLVVARIQPHDLPQSVLGYDAVDAVIFDNADPAQLQHPSPQPMDALRQYVRQGGSLIILQPADWEKTLAFADLLPVTFPRIDTGTMQLRGVVDRQETSPLYNLMIDSIAWRSVPPELLDQQNGPTLHHWIDQMMNQIDAQWQKTRPPFKVAIAQAQPQARIVRNVVWKTDLGDDLSTPYIARMAYGLGQVVWVAQDLGEPGISSLTEGWPGVWNTIFGWNDHSFASQPPANRKDNAIDPSPLAVLYPPAAGLDLGYPLAGMMELSQRGTSLILLVVLFFIAYWAIAGPVSYLWLARSKRTGLSWLVFSAIAVIATLMTIIVVELVLRTPPQLQHFSLVRLSDNGPDLIRSDIGLYIASDGVQQLELRQTAMNELSYIAPYPVNPAQITRQPDFTAPLTYSILQPTEQSHPDANPHVSIPFRSTLKKLQARWIGHYAGGFSGQLQLRDNELTGTIDQSLNTDLHDVYLCYNTPGNGDMLLYLPQWKQGQRIDLKKVTWYPLDTDASTQALPRQGRAIRQPLNRDGLEDYWSAYFFNRLRTSGPHFEDDSSAYTLALLSFFDRFGPMSMRTTGPSAIRFDLLRRGARDLDLSQLVAAGRLAICALADDPSLPMPFYVQGKTVAGRGTTFYQGSIAIEQVAPTTQSVIQPASQPVELRQIAPVDLQSKQSGTAQ